RAVRKDHPLPGDQNALLPVGHLVVVEADQPRPLRDQEVLAALGVKDVLAYLGDQLPGQVRVDASHEDRRDDRPGLDLVTAGWWSEGRRQYFRPIRRRKRGARRRRQARSGGLGGGEGRSRD